MCRRAQIKISIQGFLQTEALPQPRLTLTAESLPSKATLRQTGGFIVVMQGRENTQHLSLLPCSSRHSAVMHSSRCYFLLGCAPDRLSVGARTSDWKFEYSRFVQFKKLDCDVVKRL
ncbi:uncharacterized protein V6R79_018702 [Siganus canaliculatus]